MLIDTQELLLLPPQLHASHISAVQRGGSRQLSDELEDCRHIRLTMSTMGTCISQWH